MTQEVLDRMLMEFKENGERTNKLRAFILDEEKFNQLDNLNKDLLISQLKAMEAYISILSIRIGLNSQIRNEDVTEAEVEESESKLDKIWKMIVFILIGGGLIVWGSDVTVDAATSIAKYFNMDVSILRLVVVLLVLFAGGGLLAYLICALVIPEEPDNVLEGEVVKEEKAE